MSQGIKYFRTNKYISLAAVGVLAACLFIVGNFWLIYLNVDLNLQRLEEENQTVLFLDDSVGEEQFAQIEQSILAIGNVSACEFISKEQAFADYKEAYAEEYDLYSELDENGINPLRNSFSVTMENIELYEETVYQLSQIEGVARIRKQNQDTLDGMMTVAKSIYFVCYWIMGLLLIASLFIIMNTIKIARFTNRRQISIMKYVGWRPTGLSGGPLSLKAPSSAYWQPSSATCLSGTPIPTSWSSWGRASRCLKSCPFPRSQGRCCLSPVPAAF